MLGRLSRVIAEPTDRRSSEARERTLAIVAPFDDDDVEAAHNPIMSPLVWDLAHIAAYEDLWLAHRHGGLPLLHPELAAMYDAFETPRAVRGDLPLLDRAAGARVPRRRARAHARRCSTARRRRRHARRARPAPRAPAQRDDAAGDRARRPRRPRRACRASRSPAAAGAARSPASRRVDVPGGRCRVGAGAARLRLRQRAPAPRTDVRDFRIGRVADHQRHLPAPSSRAAATSAASGGPTRPGTGRRSTTSPTPAAGPRAGRRSGCSGASTASPRCPRRARRPRVLVRGRRLRPRPRRPPPDGGRVGEGGDLGPGHGRRDGSLGRRARRRDAARTSTTAASAAPPPAPTPDGASPCGALGMLGDVWEWTSSPFRGYAGFGAHPYREYSEVFFGDGYRVLRGGSWATRAHAATPHVPQLGPPPAAPDLLRAAAGMGRLTLESHLSDGVERDAGRRRPRRPDAPVQGAAAQAPLRRARLGAVRRDLRAARVLPDAHRARDPARPRAGGDRRARGRRRAGRARRGRGDQGAAAARHRRVHAATCPSTSPRRRWPTAPTRSADELPGARDPRRSSGDFERHLDRIPPPDRGPRLIAFLGGTIGNFTPGARRSSCARSPTLLGPGDALLLGTDLVKDLDVLEAAYDDAAGRHRRVQPQRPARPQPRARRRLRRRPLRARRVLRPACTSGSRCGCAPAARSTRARRRARPRRRLRARRGAAHGDLGEVHAASALEADYAAAGLSSTAGSPTRTERFALSLARPATLTRGMDDEGQPIGYKVLPRGTPVVTSDGVSSAPSPRCSTTRASTSSTASSSRTPTGRCSSTRRRSRGSPSGG